MNTTNILSVRFFIKQYKAKNFRAPIYARITIEGKSADVSLKRTVEISNWSAETSQAKGSRDDARSINVHLDRIRTEISNVRLDIDKDPFSKAQSSNSN